MPIVVHGPVLESHGAGAEDFRLAHAAHRGFYHKLATAYLWFSEDAEEAVQEGFLRAWRFRGQFRGQCTLSTWIGVIIRRECQDRLRRNRARKSSREVSLVAWHDPGAEDPTLDILRQADRRALVLGLLVRLRPSERQFVSRVLAGEEPDMRLRANKSARHRAVLRLRRILARRDGNTLAAAA